MATPAVEKHLSALSGDSDEALRVTWLGHSTVLIELDGVRLITDPVLRTRIGFLRRLAPTDLPTIGDVDGILISHVHHDHLDTGTLRRFRPSTRVLVPEGAGRYLRRLGFAHVVELVREDEWRVGAVWVRAIHAEHDARRFPFGGSVPSLGYVISGSCSVYFAGDTDLFEEMSGAAAALDVGLLPVAGWGPRVPAGHLDPARAAEAVRRLRPRIAVPIHWGTYRRLGMRLDDTALPAEEFADAVAAVAPEVQTCILPIGGSVELEPNRNGAHAP